MFDVSINCNSLPSQTLDNYQYLCGCVDFDEVGKIESNENSRYLWCLSGVVLCRYGHWCAEKMRIKPSWISPLAVYYLLLYTVQEIR